MPSPGAVSEGVAKFYEASVQAGAARILFSADVVVVHGLQAVGLIEHCRDERAWLWRCHSNVRRSPSGFWALAGRYVTKYRAAAFSHSSFAPDLSVPRYLLPPSVDPFSLVNRDVSSTEVSDILADLRLPEKGPMALCHLSDGSVREALDAVRLWKSAGVPKGSTLVLLHVGDQGSNPSLLSDIDRDVLRAVDPDVHFIRVGRGAARELGVLGWAARVVVDPGRSLCPNVALLDAMWKGKPVIVPRESGNATILKEGGAICAASDEDVGRSLREFLESPGAARAAGAVGRRWVAQRHLMTRHLINYFTLLQNLK